MGLDWEEPIVEVKKIEKESPEKNGEKEMMNSGFQEGRRPESWEGRGEKRKDEEE